MTEILFAVSPSVFSWRMLGRGSSAAWPTPCRTHPARVAVVALVVTGLVKICSECRTGGPREGTCHFYNKVHSLTEFKIFLDRCYIIKKRTCFVKRWLEKTKSQSCFIFRHYYSFNWVMHLAVIAWLESRFLVTRLDSSHVEKRWWLDTSHIFYWMTRLEPESFLQNLQTSDWQTQFVCKPVVARVTFSDSDSALFQNFLIRVWKFFKIENPAPVQIPATTDPTEISPCF